MLKMKNNNNNQKCIITGIKIKKLKFWKLDLLVLSVELISETIQDRGNPKLSAQSIRRKNPHRIG